MPLKSLSGVMVSSIRNKSAFPSRQASVLSGLAFFGYELPPANTREADLGVNYFLRDGLKAIVSYGRQFSSSGNANQWSFGIAYRFLVPLGRVRSNP